ncbi:NADPH-dependent methylglyoxal reductase Gre2p [[Candida] railenensis]|uniref:NADPH-dependent methylglyoxal reductase Gre2p n=1 Tax=[Candida] railenensis TaxID=45579 RepID=A0A9P0QT00_9ASCO|nr:NADPH-dependent methylglyoxal reductase Gre2p [[Candida] railenensis]
MVSVFVTGASGFIAQHIVKLLHEKGYSVVGTVRSSDKGEKLKANLGSRFQYEVVPDISTAGAFDSALEKHPEVTVVLHTASPFFYDTTDPEKDLMVPALEGTTHILSAVKKYAPQVNRFVITSSDAAFYSADDEQDGTLSFDESSWNNIGWEEATKDPISAYYGAKSYAEKKAWEIARQEDTKFVLTAVNPVYVFGPQAFANEVKPVLNTSNELINNLLKIGPTGAFDNDKGGFIDVRDVAKAHVLAFELEEAKNKRLSLTNGKFSTQMMVDILNSHFEKELKGKIPLGTPGSGPKDISTLAKVSNIKTKEILNFDFHTLEDIVIDTVQQVFDFQNKNRI